MNLSLKLPVSSASGRFSRFTVALAGLALVCWASAAPATRILVKGVPRLGGGQAVERLVLMETVHIDHPNMRRADAMEYWMLPGQFLPVAEDAEGVYYQGTSGFRIYAGYKPQESVPGGLYLSKTRNDRIFPFTGNAKDLTKSLTLDQFPLLLDVRMKLKIAHAQPKR